MHNMPGRALAVHAGAATSCVPAAVGPKVLHTSYYPKLMIFFILPPPSAPSRVTSHELRPVPSSHFVLFCFVYLFCFEGSFLRFATSSMCTLKHMDRRRWGATHTWYNGGSESTPRAKPHVLVTSPSPSPPPQTPLASLSHTAAHAWVVHPFLTTAPRAHRPQEGGHST